MSEKMMRSYCRRCRWRHKMNASDDTCVSTRLSWFLAAGLKGVIDDLITNKMHFYTPGSAPNNTALQQQQQALSQWCGFRGTSN